MSPLQEYAKRIPFFGTLTRNPAKLVPYLAYYLDEERSGAVATSDALGLLFEELRVRPPANISDVLRRSLMFVRVRGGGFRLSHDGVQKVEASLEPKQVHTLSVPRGEAVYSVETVKSAPYNSQSPPAIFAEPIRSKRDVLVIYGRDHSLREDLFAFLRALDLNPLEFEQMSNRTGSTSPFTLEVLETAFRHVQACIVLLSPDESVSLRPELRQKGDSDLEEFQPRPNVLIEAGMAIALQPTRTILIRVGSIRTISDLDGKQYVDMTGSPESRNKLLTKLRLAECDVKSHGNDWLKVGSFRTS